MEKYFDEKTKNIVVNKIKREKDGLAKILEERNKNLITTILDKRETSTQEMLNRVALNSILLKPEMVNIMKREKINERKSFQFCGTTI